MQRYLRFSSRNASAWLHLLGKICGASGTYAAIILAVLYMHDALAFRGQNALKLIMIYDL